MSSSDPDTTLGIKQSTKDSLEPIKKASDANTWDEFVDDLVEGTLNVSLEEIDSHEVERRERVEQTRAVVVGVLEAVDETDMTDEIVDLIKELTQQDMLATNQQIIDHLIEKSERGESINEVDRLLAKVVTDTEQSRGAEQSPAAAIAQGLFGEKEKAAAERMTTERETVSRKAGLSAGDSDSTAGELEDGLFEFDEDRSDEDTSDSEGIETTIRESDERL